MFQPVAIGSAADPDTDARVSEDASFRNLCSVCAGRADVRTPRALLGREPDDAWDAPGCKLGLELMRARAGRVGGNRDGLELWNGSGNGRALRIRSSTPWGACWGLLASSFPFGHSCTHNSAFMKWYSLGATGLARMHMKIHTLCISARAFPCSAHHIRMHM